MAALLQTTRVTVDRWQSAQMIEGLRRRHLWVSPVVCDAAWLDRAAMNLKLWFSQRHLRIPSHPALLEELEGLEAEELRRRDRVRFTATGSNHDDGCVALCLAAESFAGKLRPETTQIGRPKLAEIARCAAADYLGEDTVQCPVANEVPSLQPGCRRCPMFQSVEPFFTAHLSSGAEWTPIGVFVAGHLQPNQWLRERRMASTFASLR